MNRLLSEGLTYLFRGARRGQAPLASLGTALAIIGFLRDRRKPPKELVYARNLKDGESIRIRLVRGGTMVDERDVQG
jgi:hypothetical protein